MTFLRLGSGEYSYDDDDDKKQNATKREYNIPDKENPSKPQESENGEETEIEGEDDNYYDASDLEQDEAARKKQLSQQEEEEEHEEKEM